MAEFKSCVVPLPLQRSPLHESERSPLTEEDRKALLGHKNGSITSHYSAAELGKLIDEVNRP